MSPSHFSHHAQRFTSLLFALAFFCGPASRACAQVDASVCDVANVQHGIDVSRWNGTIDWRGVARAGKQFAIARATLDLHERDAEFAANWAGIREAGLVRGAYHFFYPLSDAVAQADFFLSVVGPLHDDDLPPALDIEPIRGLAPPDAMLFAMRIRAFVDRVHMRTGRMPIIYTRARFWNAYVQSDGFNEDALWTPDYANECAPIPLGWDHLTFRQISNEGRVMGIAGNVDLDVFNGTFDDLHALANSPHCSATCEGTVHIASDCTRTDCAAFSENCVSDELSARCVAPMCPRRGQICLCASERARARCVDGMLSDVQACTNESRCVYDDAGVQCDTASNNASIDASIDAAPEHDSATRARMNCSVSAGAGIPCTQPASGSLAAFALFLGLKLVRHAITWASKIVHR